MIKGACAHWCVSGTPTVHHASHQPAQDTAAAMRPHRQRAKALVGRIRRGMIRYLQLVVDMSRAATVPDWRPSRLVVIAGAHRGMLG